MSRRARNDDTDLDHENDNDDDNGDDQTPPPLVSRRASNVSANALRVTQPTPTREEIQKKVNKRKLTHYMFSFPNRVAYLTRALRATIKKLNICKLSDILS